MPVAKSFQTFEQLCEPYLSSGRMYTQVRNPKTGTVRTVRWYDDKEYAKLYPEEAKIVKTEKGVKTQKEVLGFEKGYITIFKGKVDDNLMFLEDSVVFRYTRFWGWYVISTEKVPALPEGLTPVRLNWELVGNPNGSLKREEEIAAAIENLLCAKKKTSTSQFSGTSGERLDLYVTVIESTVTEDKFGKTTLHIMQDNQKNVYTWTTAAKNWAEGSQKHIRGTVKDHVVVKGEKQTVLTRCMEVT
jgi:hypothetical protein